MTLKVETAKIPDTNSNHILSYEEYKINGQTKKQNVRNFVVPEDKTDEFIKKYSKTEKVSSTTRIICGLTGFFGIGGIALQTFKKSPKSYWWDLPFYAAIAGFCIGTVIPSLIADSHEKKLLKNCNATEIKPKK